MKTLFQTKEICEQTGCTHRQLQYWEKKGYLNPKLGPRNVRLFDRHQLELVHQMVQKKKSGKSLGEAFSLSAQPKLTAASPMLKPDTMADIVELEKQWMEQFDELLQLAHSIYDLEKRIPRYPYFIYNQDDLETLKKLQGQVVRVKKQKDETYKELQERLLLLKQEESQVTVEKKTHSIENIPKPTLSLDQLVILWIKKYGDSNITDIRTRLWKRLQNGETAEDIYAAHFL